MKYWLSLIVASLIALGSNTVYAKDLSTNFNTVNNNKAVELNIQANNNNDKIESLKKRANKIQNAIEENNKQIELVNQIVFFYSEKNITNVFEAVQNSEIESTPILQFDNAKCGYPIYNGAQKKLDKLMRENKELSQGLEATQQKIAKIQNHSLTFEK